MKRKQKVEEESVESPEIKSKTKKLKQIEETDAVENEDEEMEVDNSEDGESTVATSNFDMKKFRQNLKKGNFFDGLKEFVKISQKSDVVVKMFVESGGKPLEIVEVIKNSEESNLELVSGLYKMLRFVIFHLINCETEKVEPTIQALKFLVNRNKLSINNMLKSSKTADKVLMLKILSIAISLDSETGRDILKTVDMFAKCSEKEDYSMLEDSKKDKILYEDTSRLAFVHFVLAFLLDDKNVMLRKKLLQKRNLFEFFMRDLHEDSYEVIKLVLTNLTKNVLISVAFSKPEKLKIFTDDVIKSVLKLYEWAGPKNSKLSKFNNQDKASVVTITHQFLLLLLTSKKHGIVFKALSEKRQNLRQLQVISWFKDVWMKEYPSMLVIEILKSCPDLMQNILNRLVFALHPQMKPSFFMAVNFTKELLKSLEPPLMFKHFSMLEPKKISSNIIKLSISQFILQNFEVKALIQVNNLAVREQSSNLLYLMLNQCCKYLAELKNIPTLKDFEKHRIKFDVINHIFTFFPNVDIILNSLYRSINFVRTKPSEADQIIVKNQLKNTLEILLLIIKNFPAIIEKIPSVIDYLEVLRPIYEYNLTDSDNFDKNEDLEIEMKVVKIIMFLEPSILSLESEMFSKIFLALIQVYCCSTTEDYKHEAKFLLTAVLMNTGIFQADNMIEIDMWIESFNTVSRSILKDSANAFVRTLRYIKSADFEVNSGSENKKLIPCDGSFFELLGKIDENQGTSECSVVVNQCELSPVLSAFLLHKYTNSTKLSKIMEFVEVSTLFFYQFIPQSKDLIGNLLKNEKLKGLDTKMVTYFKSQSSGKSLVDFSKYLVKFEDFLYAKFNKAIIAREKVEFDVKSEKQLEILIIQAIFYAIKLSEAGKLDEESQEVICYYIEFFYNKLLEVESQSESFASDHLDVMEKIQLEDAGEVKKVNKVLTLDIKKSSEVIVKHIFNNQTMLLDEFSLVDFNSMTKLVTKLSDIFRSSEMFEKYTQSYCSKVVSDLCEIISGSDQETNEEILEVLNKFPLGDSDCHKIINELLKVKECKNKFLVSLLSFLLKQLTELRTQSLDAKQVQQIERIYLDATADENIDLTELEVQLLEYMMVFNHNIGNLSPKIFELAFDVDQRVTTSKSYVKLLSFIFERNSKWNKIYTAQLKKMTPGLKKGKEVMYPLLNVALKKNLFGSGDGEQLKSIYNDYKPGILKAIEKPSKAAQIYRENVTASVKLIEICMPINECNDLAMKKFKFEQTEFFQLKMLQKIFEKAMQANSNKPDVKKKMFVNFVNHWLQLFNISMTKQSVVNQEYVKVLQEWFDMWKEFTAIQGSEINPKFWEFFYKMSLKNGLKSTGEDANMLLLLGKFINIFIHPKDAADEIAQIFDMVLTHSNFFSVAFNYKSAGKEMKRNLFFLLNILVQKNPAVAQEKHVPIFLSAYQATMSSCDQLILNLMRFYELRCEIDLYEYRPYLFGPAALSHFSSNEDKELKLMKKSIDDTSGLFSKLLNLFEKNMVDMTLNNYPIKRELAGVGREDLEKFLVESDDVMDNIYDPGYFLPLFDIVFATSTFDFTALAIKNNLLVLIWPALSCEDENMRLLAAHVLMKCRESTEGKKIAKEIWVRLYDSVQNGLGEIMEGTGATKKEVEVKGKSKKKDLKAKNKEKPKEEEVVKHFPRAASLSTQFIAEIAGVLPNTLHPTYTVLANYLIVRKSFDFTTIPEILLLFHSSEVQFQEHRQFLLNAIYNGIKDDLDWKLLNNTPLLKMIFSCYGCPLSDRKQDYQILRIVDKVVRKMKKIDFLVQRFGLVLWIYQISVAVEAFEYDTIEMILTLIKNMHLAIGTELFGDDKRKEMFNKKLLLALLAILPKFTKTRLTPGIYSNFLKTINSIQQFSGFDDVQYKEILAMTKVFVPETHTWQLDYIQNNPTAIDYLGSSDEANKNFITHMDDVTKDILKETREFLVKYHQKKLK